MEIPVINRISDLELSLQNPSMFSRVFPVSGFEVIRFWKWGALVLALVASFSTIMNRVRILIVKFQRASSAASEPLLKLIDDDDIYSSDDDDDDDDETSSVSSSIEEEEEEEEEEPMDEDFRVSGSGRGYFGRSQGQSRNSKQWQRFSWTDLASGSVVKLWDHLGLGLDFDGEVDGNLISVYDMNREQRVTSLLGGRSVVMAVSPLNSGSVVTAAEKAVSGNVSLKVWDTRVRCRIPEILAEWGPQLGKKIVAVGYGGVGKVHVRDDDSEYFDGEALWILLLGCFLEIKVAKAGKSRGSDKDYGMAERHENEGSMGSGGNQSRASSPALRQLEQERKRECRSHDGHETQDDLHAAAS
ncbi:hypothetical protein SO802_017836 [Lithocarpus litseifolius]|uniref:Uncharacterized protein n=1 Tax=Lithocarpus litseifolius TaxID=425828 RepID=A0AAW2CKF1_9ROSI